MKVDIVEIMRNAVAEELAPLRSEMAGLRAELRRPAEPLYPLSQILQCSKGAARMRETRTPALLAVAVPNGRQRLYRVADVERVLGERTKPPTRVSTAALVRAREIRHMKRAALSTEMHIVEREDPTAKT
jgi:hypothetical protein